MAEEVKRTRRRGITRISTKHQITIPVEALREAGLGPGDELRVEAAGNGRLSLVRPTSPWEEFIGDMDGVYTPGFLDKLRDEWR